jgi:hypothetical protein
VPGPDGRVIFTGRGMFTQEAKPAGRAGGAAGECTLPSVQGHYYFVLAAEGVGAKPAGTLYLEGHSRPLVKPTGIQWPLEINLRGTGRITLDQRVLYFPDYQTIVSIPAADDRLVVQPFAVEDAMLKASIDFLFVASRPPLSAAPGKTYTYTPDVKSRKKGVVVRLDAGPPGMKVSEEGKVTWEVPADFAGKTAEVALKVRDGSGQEVVHSFRITVAGVAVPKKDPPPPEPVPLSGVIAEVAWSFEPPKKSELRAPFLARSRVPVNLPGPAVDAVVGGGGRYLLLHIPSKKTVAVFDVNQVSVVKQLPVEEDVVYMAAGMEKLILIRPGKSTIQRYSLSTFEIEKTAELPVKGRVAEVAMGWASNGPLLLWEKVENKKPRDDAFHFVDPETLDLLKTPGLEGLAGRLAPKLQGTAASGNGKVFAFRSKGSLQSLVRRGNRWVLYASSADSERASGLLYALPSLDGSVICTSAGLFSDRCAERKDEGTTTLPALNGPYYLGDNSIYLPGNPKPFLGVPTRTAAEIKGLGPRNGVFWEKHFYVIPNARVMLFLTGSNTQVVVDPFDVLAGLERSRVPYLYVTSQPTEVVKGGETFTYKVTARSRRGGVRMTVIIGPKGMTVAPDGTVTWKVPAAEEEEEVDVTIGLTDAANVEAAHTFTLTVLPNKPKKPQP